MMDNVTTSLLKHRHQDFLLLCHILDLVKRIAATIRPKTIIQRQEKAQKGCARRPHACIAVAEEYNAGEIQRHLVMDVEGVRSIA